MSYDPHTSDVTVLQAGMTYPNGVALSADRSHLVCRVYWPVQAATALDQRCQRRHIRAFCRLPGYPDNVRPDMKGGYWVALHREKKNCPLAVVVIASLSGSVTMEG
ncbi:Strictosidine synthase 1 [Hordeum vulgare]|nr:Strictosidine synthase 1 [Hordeum vulgare]